MMRIFKKQEDQNEKLIKNMEEYAKKEEIKQQESKVLGQKPVKGEGNKEKRTSVYNSSRL
jgi:uncharacterized protein YjaZ